MHADAAFLKPSVTWQQPCAMAIFALPDVDSALAPA
jgi:hypothetical protein